MHEIKFRGKRIDNGEFVYGFYTEIEHNDDKSHKHHYIMPVPLLENQPEDKPIIVEVDPVTVGQYIGLKDKNGMEIFDGDILQLYRHSDITHKHEKDYMSTVKFTRGSFYTTIEKYGIDICFINMARPGQSYEVIGNIYANPELLGVQA